MKKQIMKNDWAMGDLRLAKAYRWSAEMARIANAPLLIGRFRHMMRYHAKECIRVARIEQ